MRSTKESTSVERVFHGQIKGHNDQFINVEISEKDFPLFKQCCGKELFDIFFKVNTLPYKIQLYALKYMDTFGLHKQIIANPKYNYIEEHTDVDHANYNFR